MTDKFLDQLADLAVQNNTIPRTSYERYDVKRGLRNKDGSGVLVGLTEIGDVHGYVVSEKDIHPVEGDLYYRGYSVRDLVKGSQEQKRFGFEETIYLLLFGELPTHKQLEQFTELMRDNMNLPPRFNEDMIMIAPSQNIMNKLARSVLALYSTDEDPDNTSIRNVLRQSIELLARFPILIAYGYQALQHYFHQQTLHIRLPEKQLGLAENFLHLVRLSTTFSKLEAEILDLALVLHAEHGGGNNSTFAVHVVTSSATDTYSAIAAAIGSLKGPKHGGANASVMKMMANIKEKVKDWEDKDEIAHYLTKIVRKEAFDRTGLIYGIGHAVYTLSDPRAVIFKNKIQELAAALGSDRTKEMNLYKNVENMAPKVLRKHKSTIRYASANVDFYSGFVYDMLGMPQEIYTPIFAMARLAGWCAHRIEELISGGRIIRPAYKNISRLRKYVSLGKRKPKKRRWPLSRG